MKTRLVGLSALVLFACRTPSESGSSPGAKTDIPIRKVILYQNGVGYFERSGTLDGDRLTLQIRPDQINDLLKSLTVIDRSSGRAVSVSLPLEKTGAQRLTELPQQVRSAGGLLEVLSVFRGARVEVHGGDGTVRGRVVGVEAMTRGEDGQMSGWKVTLKSQSGELRVYDVDEIERVTLEDRTLSVGLEKSLDVSLNEGNWKPIDLSVRLVGAEQHDLVASYIVEMPLWKPAYRIVIDEGQPLLQGWAVVDNVSGEDWNGIELSLVAGTPMSFLYDLHSPQYTQRIDLTPKHRRIAAAPVVEKPGVVGGAKNELQKSYAKKRSARGRARRSARPPPPMSKSSMARDMAEEMADEDDLEESAMLGDELERQAPGRAEGQSLGALFRYDLKDPVTIPDRSSTLVAIVNQRVKGQEVVLFRPELTRGQSNPYRAVLFENDTGFTLEKGPVTIYSGGTFVGEGFIERMEKGLTSFLTFSIDGNVTLKSRAGREEKGLRLVKIVDGRLVSEVQEIERTTYSVNNRHPTAVTAYVKTAMRSGWTLADRPSDTVEAGNALFVPVTVESGAEKDLVVEWTKKVIRRVAIDTSMSTSLLRVYLEGGEAPPAIKPKLERILAIKARISDITSELRHLRKQQDELTREQNRVRENLKLLRKTKGNKALQQTMVQKLARLERDLGKLSGKRVRGSDEKAGLEREMKVLIRNISLK